MTDIERIKSLIDRRGMTITYICGCVGQKPRYLDDVKRRKGNIPAERLSIIARELGTTVEYLRDETDDPAIPQKGNTLDLSEIDPERAELIKQMLELPLDKVKAINAILGESR